MKTRKLLIFVLFILLLGIGCKQNNNTNTKCQHEIVSFESKEATCTKEGNIEYYHCTKCNKYYIDKKLTIETTYEELIINKTNHIESDWIVDIEATCDSQGLKHKECTICKEKLQEEVIDTIEHHYSEWEIIITSTNDAKGLKSRKCLVCNNEELEVIPELNHSHDYVDTVIAPTCTEDGYTIHTCHCGDEYKDNYVEALGHTEEIITGLDATCTESGLTEGKKCSVCGEILVKQEVIKAKEHNYGDWVIVKPATEQETGLKTRKCFDCEKEETVEIPTLDHIHSYDETVIAPTCTEEGYTLHKCLCGDEYKDTYVDALGHTEEIILGLDATCTESGLTEGKKCSVCGEILVKQEVIKAKGHNYSTSNIVLLDEGNKAITRYYCSNCISYKDEIYSGHYLLDDFAYEFDNSGNRINLNESFIEVNGNTYYIINNTIVKNYYIIDGTIYDFGNDGIKQETILTDRIISFEDNLYYVINNIIQKEVFIVYEQYIYYFNETGKAIVNTTYNGYTFNANGYLIGNDILIEINKVLYYVVNNIASVHNHSLEHILYNHATCTADGNIEYFYCTTCNRLYKDNDCTNEITNEDTIIKASHNITKYEGKESTCTEQGYKAYEKCANCSYSTFESLPLKEHNYVNGVCIECNQVKVPSEGLEFTLKNDEYYEVTGIGTCTDSDIVIPSTYNGKPVTSIGSGAFSRCINLTSITIPESVTSIGSSAFWDCSKLTSITIPDSVTSIGYGAFSGCKSLTNIFISDIVAWCNITGLSDIMTYGLSKNLYLNNELITNLTIPDSVTSIGDDAFSYCSSLTSINVDKNNKVYDSRDNCNAIIETKTNSLLIGCSNTIIPNSVTSIGSSAFSGCINLTSITIPESVTSIGSSAFEGCSNLTSITIPDSVTSIGDCAFYGCINLTSITIPDSVTSIGYGAFWGCSNLISINVDKNNKIYDSRDNCNAIIETKTNSLLFGCSNTIIPNSVTSIEWYAFRDCTSLTSITIPDSVTSIGSSAFSGCINLTSITIPESVTSIGSSAFEGCSNLTSITIPDSVTSIGSLAFSYCSNLTNIFISDIVAWCNITGLSDIMTYGLSKNLYLNNELITNLTIPDGVTSIGYGAFWGCSNLTSITIPDSVTSIGSNSFSYCSNLTCITIPDSVTSIGYFAFYGCINLTSITIPDSVTSIGDWAFEGCSGLTSITIPESVTSIGSSAFSYCSNLTSINVDINNKVYDSRDNCNAIIETKTNSLLIGCSNTIIPNSVTSIGSAAFSGCMSLTSITIPDSVTSIGSSAFSGCSNLTSITIPDSVTSIGISAFSGCSNLTSITIPESVTSIGSSAFRNCSNLTSINVDKNNKVYDSRDNCNAIIETKTNSLLIGCSNTIIPNSVTSIGSSAFSGCINLTSITIPESVTSIDYYVFWGCTSLTSITIPDSVTSIGDAAFIDCSSLTIYCKVKSKPIGWSAYWNIDNRPTFWGSNFNME